MQIALKKTICMKCQILFSLGKIRKNVSKCHLLTFLPSMQSVKYMYMKEFWCPCTVVSSVLISLQKHRGNH